MSQAVFESTEMVYEISVVDALVRVCLEGHAGFRRAADLMEDASLKSELYSYSVQRREFAARLHDLLDQPRSPSSRVSFGVHHEWGGNRRGPAAQLKAEILHACRRNEESAHAVYADALHRGLSPRYAETIAVQARVIEQTFDRIRMLCDTPVDSGTWSG